MTNEKDQFADINASMTYSVPNLGDNVLRHAKLLRVCKTRGCYEPVFVSSINWKTGRVKYTCPKHGKRDRSQMDWLDITGSTMLEFRRAGTNDTH